MKIAFYDMGFMRFGCCNLKIIYNLFFQIRRLKRVFVILQRLFQIKNKRKFQYCFTINVLSVAWV